MAVGKGRGYVQAEKNRREEQPIGVIPIDSIFSPIKKVNFHVENTRVGQLTDYERLILEIWTNGSIVPKDAILHASHILDRHLDIFVNFGEGADVHISSGTDPLRTFTYSTSGAKCIRYM